ncbi:phosphatase PAP2 family protein [Promicromonospora sp. NPDC023805]|uniref:phosphatase PAP2 family protein n=1 Tax=Promicromonospora sp. NPDC023805 TaxID=3154696 RepID=UPI003409B190
MPTSERRLARHDGSRTGPHHSASHSASQSASHSASHSAAPSGPRRPTARATGLTVAFAAALGTWLVWWAMVTTWPGQRVEERVFETADRFQDVVNHLVEPVLLLGSPPWLVAGFLAVCGIGLLRRRPAAASLAAVVILGSNLTTQVIKDGVFHRTGLVGEWNRDINTLPSGHVTVVAAAWAALLLVVPRGWRPATALAGAAATCAMSLATVADRWHRPSDVVAAVLVVVAWTSLVCAFAPAGWAGPDRAGPDGAGPAGGGDGAALPVIALLGTAAVPMAVLSVLAAAATEGRLLATAPWDDGLTAYLGGLLAVCAISAFGFAVLLWVCRTAPGSRRA